jgi:hypothetical protein
MTRTTNARIAGVTFLVYIAAGITSMILFGRATGGEGIAEKLSGLARHVMDVRVVVLLGVVQCFAALVLAVTLYAITREQDPDLAMFGLVCRVGEGVIVGLSNESTLGALRLATATGADAAGAGAYALGRYLLGGEVALTATFFAVGSTVFAFLLLRGRMIPAALAWLGVGASVLLVAVLPLQLAGFLAGPITMVVWLPMLVFEVALAVWFLAKGVASPPR